MIRGGFVRCVDTNFRGLMFDARVYASWEYGCDVFEAGRSVVRSSTRVCCASCSQLNQGGGRERDEKLNEGIAQVSEPK